MRRASGILAVLFLLLSALPVAAGGKPTREPAPLPALIVDTSCGFTVNVTFPVNTEYALTFYDGAGHVTRIIVTGHLVVTFTNPATGATYTANISGPTFIDFVRSTNVLTGRQGGELGTLPGLHVFAGRADYSTGTMHGHVVADVCALLAP